MNTRACPDRPELRQIYDLPLTTLLFEAQRVHRLHHDGETVQLSTLLSIKTGRCPEDCKYCPQSAHYNTAVAPEPLMEPKNIVAAAREAKASGATRFCMGAAWREVPNGPPFDAVLAAVKGVAELGGMEVCCTLGMMRRDQAEQLRAAGCDFYNHNLDTSREYYREIITTRTYDDRLATLRHAAAAGLNLCCGGIIGMGETVEDRLNLLFELTQLVPHPTSVPINAFVPVEGTPLAHCQPVDPLEFVRIVATARIVLPQAEVRLSAGRAMMSDELQALCFMAGANSIFFGEKLLTTPNAGPEADQLLLKRLGLKPLKFTAQPA